MGFQKNRFGLFFSLPLDDTDWENLEISRVRLVMLMLNFADRNTLSTLAAMGARVVLRVGEDTYYSDDAPQRIAAQVAAVRGVCPVEAVIVGNEPDHALNFNYGSNTWGQQFAYVHRQRFDGVRIALQGMGVKVISPALIMRSISEDEPPAPGRVSWREIVCLPDRSREEAEGKHGYLDADGNGGHIYEYGWTWPVDPLRFKFAVKHNLELWHKPLWIDELGVEGGAAPVDKMRAYLQMADILLSEVNSEQHPLGQRVEFLCPFVSNGHPGSPPSWDIRYLMRDRACYELLGQWMAA